MKPALALGWGLQNSTNKNWIFLTAAASAGLLIVCFPSNPLPLWGRVIVMCAGSLRHAQTLLLVEIEREEKIGDKVGWSWQIFFVSHNPQNRFCRNSRIVAILTSRPKVSYVSVPLWGQVFSSFDEVPCSRQKRHVVIKHRFFLICQQKKV